MEDSSGRPVGRPLHNELREQGEKIRERLCRNLFNNGLSRPMTNASPRHDQYNRVIICDN